MPRSEFKGMEDIMKDVDSTPGLGAAGDQQAEDQQLMDQYLQDARDAGQACGVSRHS